MIFGVIRGTERYRRLVSLRFNDTYTRSVLLFNLDFSHIAKMVNIQLCAGYPIFGDMRLAYLLVAKFLAKSRSIFSLSRNLKREVLFIDCGTRILELEVDCETYLSSHTRLIVDWQG